MTDSANPEPKAWQPFTPRGVAAFARAPLRRLLLLQFLFALCAAVATVWFLRSAWFPTIRQAISQLPADGQMKSGKLYWPGASPVLLAEGHFLAFDVDTNHSGGLRSPAQIQVEFGREDIYFYSLAGYREWPYPGDWNFGFNRVALQPWWGAWEPPIQGLAFAGTMFWCLAGWTALATIYFLPVWLAGLFGDRDLKIRESWKLAGAALMPGAAVMIAAIVLYGFGALDLVQFSAAVVMHVLVGWAYLVWTVWKWPRAASTAAAAPNPFSSALPVTNDGAQKPTKLENPFSK